jgi:hypothetical protein
LFTAVAVAPVILVSLLLRVTSNFIEQEFACAAMVAANKNANMKTESSKLNKTLFGINTSL